MIFRYCEFIGASTGVESREWLAFFPPRSSTKNILLTRCAQRNVFLAHANRFIRPMGTLNLCLVAFPCDYRPAHPFHVPRGTCDSRGVTPCGNTRASSKPVLVMCMIVIKNINKPAHVAKNGMHKLRELTLCS